MPRKPQDYVGQVFGDLTVIGNAPNRGSARYLHCICVCGNTTEVHLSNLKRQTGGIHSCSCANKHGGSGTRLHSIWRNMKQRCYNSKHTNYKHYGAIGVVICTEWRNSFVLFREWALASGYSDDLSLDRIAGALLYSPNTCRWATQETQCRNRRNIENTSSKFTGVVFFRRTSRWLAYISVSGKRTYLGYHATEVDAACARDNYIIENGLTDFVLNRAAHV